MSKPMITVGSLRFVLQGALYCCFYIPPGAPDYAVLLGSIAFGMITDNPSMEKRFMDLMQEGVAALTTHDVVFSEPPAGTETIQ